MLSGVSYLFNFKNEKHRDYQPILYVRTSKYPKQMKFAAVIIGNLQVLQVYRLPNRISTAIEASSAMVPSWIRILVRSIKKEHHHHLNSISYPSFI